jgi:hypothetical protein
MQTNKRGTFTIYLAGWQKNVVKDFYSARKRVTQMIINIDDIICPASYKVLEQGMSKRDWVMYLTEEQMAIVQQKFRLRTPVTGINVTEQLLQKKHIVFK